jgi:hypothetical protein
MLPQQSLGVVLSDLLARHSKSLFFSLPENKINKIKYRSANKKYYHPNHKHIASTDD